MSNTMLRSSIYWKAVYKDGTSLTQFEEGIEKKYPDIDRSKLVAFEIRKAAVNNNPDKLFFRLHLDPGRRLIYRRRVKDNYKIGGTPGNPKLVPYWQEVVYLVGWQATIEGRNVQDIAYIFSDGHVELAGMWRTDNAIMNKPGNLLGVEQKFYSEKHLGISAKVVKRNNKHFGISAVLVEKKKEGAE